MTVAASARAIPTLRRHQGQAVRTVCVGEGGAKVERACLFVCVRSRTRVDTCEAGLHSLIRTSYTSLYSNHPFLGNQYTCFPRNTHLGPSDLTISSSPILLSLATDHDHRATLPSPRKLRHSTKCSATLGCCLTLALPAATLQQGLGRPRPCLVVEYRSPLCRAS